jgi:hypothetical protein
MNQFINQLERKYGKYAIKNISLYLALLFAGGYLIYALDASFFNYISLNPYMLMRGQIWRLVTWIIIPPSLGINMFFVLLLLYVFYNFGNNLERAIGAFRYNLYLFSGMFFTVIGSLILLVYVYLAVPEGSLTPEIAEPLFANMAMSFSTFYIYMSIFLAVAVIMPDMQILLMFILPVKMKYIGIIYGFVILLDFIQNGTAGRIVVGASLLNFLIFFFMMRKNNIPSTKQIKRKVVHNFEEKKVKYNTRHKCAVCGVTDEQAPEREFRYCSKCHGNYEYCDQHLYTHTHVTGGEEDGE